jgi:hypothetical protein
MPPHFLHVARGAEPSAEMRASSMRPRDCSISCACADNGAAGAGAAAPPPPPPPAPAPPSPAAAYGSYLMTLLHMLFVFSELLVIMRLSCGMRTRPAVAGMAAGGRDAAAESGSGRARACARARG